MGPYITLRTSEIPGKSFNILYATFQRLLLPVYSHPLPLFWVFFFNLAPAFWLPGGDHTVALRFKNVVPEEG